MDQSIRHKNLQIHKLNNTCQIFNTFSIQNESHNYQKESFEYLYYNNQDRVDD